MKKVWIYAVITAFVGILSGCLDNNNSYDYKQINEMQGCANNFGNFSTEYSVFSGQELKLEPTFKFTMDSISPDVSYEWYLNHKLLTEETGPTYTFLSDRSGTYEVTFAVQDNKTGVKFSSSTFVKVRSVYQRGWVILSEENGRSVLHFIIPDTYKYSVTYNGTTFMRDSLVYHEVRRDIVPDLGTNPVGLMNNIGDMDYSGDYGIEVYDELVVKQDTWVELNGNTFEREVYTYQEFGDVSQVPEDFSPVEAAMTYSAKAVRDKNGQIYWENKGDVTDFHAGFYTPVGLNNNTLFSRLFEAYKFNQHYTNVFLALTKEDNSFVGILDLGYAYGGTTITENSSYSSGNVYAITEESATHFSNVEKEVVDARPVPYESSNDISSAEACWVALLKNDAHQYDLWYFTLKGSKTKVTCEDFYENSLGVISDYRDMAVFGNKRYTVIANGNQLYYYQFGSDYWTGTEYKGNLQLLGEAFPSKIKSLSCIDVENNTYLQKYPYNGQLGVALEDGSFYIFGVEETKNEETGVCTGAKIKQLFPNETTSEENKNFGKIVDVLYKLGRGMDYMSFSF